MMQEFVDALKNRAKRFVIGLGVGAVVLGAKIAVRAGAEAAANDAAADSALAIADKATEEAARLAPASTASATPAPAAPAPATPAGAQGAAQSPAQRPAQSAAPGITQGPVIAGPPITAPRQAAMRVAAATDAHTAAMTDPDASAATTATTANMVTTPSRPATATATTASRVAPAQPAPPAGGSGTPTHAPTQPAATRGRPAGQSVSVSVGAAGAEQPGEISFVRETFAYAAGGRRDPFVSLMANGELRPMIADLRLVAVAYDPTGRNSVAIMRDVSTKEQYRVKVGQTLGRMRAARIQPKEVVFTIEEFGLSRQAVLALSDSTTARTK